MRMDNTEPKKNFKVKLLSFYFYRISALENKISFYNFKVNLENLTI